VNEDAADVSILYLSLLVNLFFRAVGSLQGGNGRSGARSSPCDQESLADGFLAGGFICDDAGDG